MSLALSIDSKNALQVVTSVTLRPKPDRRKTPRFAVDVDDCRGSAIYCEAERACTDASQLLKTREPLALL